MVERYFALVARVEPFLTIPFSEHRNKDKMLRTPVLPIHGIVESKPVIFSLRLEHNVSRQELYAYAVYSLLTKKMTSLPIVKK